MLQYTISWSTITGLLTMCSRYDNYVNEVNSECTNVQESEQNPVLNKKKTRQDNDYKENNMNKTESPKLNIEN